MIIIITTTIDIIIAIIFINIFDIISITSVFR